MEFSHFYPPSAKKVRLVVLLTYPVNSTVQEIYKLKGHVFMKKEKYLYNPYDFFNSMRVLAAKKQELLLDKKDWRVLKEIVNNIRQPVSQIAKKCLLSRQAVEYRLKLLRQNDHITGSRAVVNIRKLGYKSYHIFLEVHTPAEERKIISRAMKADYVNAIITYSGKYNLEISIMAREEEEFLDYYEKLIRDVRIRDDHVLILLDTLAAQVLPARYFPAMKEIGPPSFASAKKVRKGEHIFDNTDLRILFALSQDATRTNISLAKDLKVSKDTIQYRIGKLEHEKYVLEYRPVVNYAALGMMINSVLLKVNHLQSSMGEFRKLLKVHGSILWATKTLGYYDYLVYVITKDLEEFHEVINGMKEKYDDIIKTYEILFAFEELKYNFMAESIVGK